MFKSLSTHISFISEYARFTNLRAMSTVFALSSGQGKCGVAVVRITGDAASSAITSMTRPAFLPPPRRAALRPIMNPVTNIVLDHGLVLWFPGPASFTGEDSVELQVHGGAAVVAAVLAALGELPGYRQALAGEFTRRAFANGKLDLTGVEGLADLLCAETEHQRRLALRQCEGALGVLYSGWRQQLLQVMARVEAHIDFGEEGHEQIPDVSADVCRRVTDVCHSMETHLADGRRGEILRCGVQLAILGRPNVGKSSCLNTLLQRPAAIVSDVPGTTRDIVTGTVDIGGYPVVVMDTAGLRHTDDTIERQGVDRAVASATQADAAIIILDATEVLVDIRQQSQMNESRTQFFGQSPSVNVHKNTDRKETDIVKEVKSKENIIIQGDNSDEASLQEIRNAFNLNRYLINYFNNSNQSGAIVELTKISWFQNSSYVLLLNKIDLLSEDELMTLSRHVPSSTLVSLRRGDGVDSALTALTIVCSELCSSGAPEQPVLTTARQRVNISAAVRSLLQLQALTRNLETDKHVSYESSNDNSSKTRMLMLREEDLATAAHYLHQAARHLGYVTGHITTEHVLDQIFKEFCIGK